MTSLPLSKTLAKAKNAPYEPVDPDHDGDNDAPGSTNDPDAGKDGSTSPLLLDQAAVMALNSSPQGKKLIAWVDANYTKSKNGRREYERQWYLNLAFYSGKQYVEWSNNEDKMITQPVRSIHTPRLTINKIQPIIRTEQAKLTGQKPSVSVMPSSNDDADMFAATAGEQVWESLYTRLNFPNKLSRAAFWLSICGTSYIKTYWDENAYDAVSQMDGDVCWQPLSPFNILVPDMLEPDIEKQAWVMDIQTKPVQWIKDQWPDFFPNGVAPTVAGVDDVLSAAKVGIRGGSTNQPDSTVIKEVWIKPWASPDLPEGGMLTIVSGKIVQAAVHGLPYDHKETPFAKLEHIPSGKFYGISTIEALIPLQREYNRTQSQVVEAKNRNAKPQTWFREGSLDPTKITTEPGLMIPVRGSAEYPQERVLPELPSYINVFNNRMDGDFEDISGQHSQTRGEAPAGMAATAIAYLQEQDDAYLSTSFQSIEQAIEKVARQSLVLAVAYWTLPRLIKATGEDGGFDAIMLRGSQIANSTDIRVESGTALPLSKSAKQAQVTDWMNRGLIPPEDGFELLDMPMIQAWVNKRKVDKKAAQIENIGFRALDPAYLEQQALQWVQENAEPMVHPVTGEPAVQTSDLDPASNFSPVNGPQLAPPLAIPVNVWDDHAVHIQIHNLWRKSPSYALVDNAIKAEVQKHVDMHQQALQDQQMQQAQMQQAMGPAPAGPPAAAIAPPNDQVDQTTAQAGMIGGGIADALQ